MAYCGYTDVVNYIDAVNLNAMLDDYAQGVAGQIAQNAQLASICQIASDAVDAYIASIYSVPFPTPPSPVKQASVIFACEILYKRRLTPDEKNPFTPEANVWRSRLEKIGAGDLPLDEKFNRGFPPVVFSLKKSPVNDNIF